MKEKIKTPKGFIQIPLLIVIIVSTVVISVGGYGGLEYYKTSKLVKEADQFTEEEKYKEAIEKLNLAQVSWFVKNLAIKKQEIFDKQEENKKLTDELSKYNQGLDEFDKENYQEAIDLFSEIPEDSFYSNNAKLKTEEAKRKIVEEELGKTKIAKEKAEVKAQQEAIKRSQEEMARKAKEQELATKEAQEKTMNTDNDGDGLTYRRELELGTSDWNTDSDDDGIPDNLDTHPAGGGRNIPQIFTWSYGGYNWTWTESIHEDWYDYYKAKPRIPVSKVDYITYNDPFIQKIAKNISEAATKNNLSNGALATAFVQSLSYVDDVYTGYDEYPKYPVETFIEKNGDCEDTSYLAASIIRAMNIDSVLILLPGHMAVGVWMNCNTSGTSYKSNNRCYYYTETTGEEWSSGKIPDEYKYLSATLIKIPSGETIANVSPQYVKPCDYSPDLSAYFDGKNFYTDSQCNNLTYCLSYQGYYVNPKTFTFYWDSSCSQMMVKGCSKSTTYPGYFTNGINYYSDSQCIQKARVCRPSLIYSDRYWDGDYNYWDSNCMQKVVSWCSKSIYYPGYFFSSIDYKIYVDYQCTQLKK